MIFALLSSFTSSAARSADSGTGIATVANAMSVNRAVLFMPLARRPRAEKAMRPELGSLAAPAEFARLGVDLDLVANFNEGGDLKYVLRNF